MRKFLAALCGVLLATSPVYAKSEVTVDGHDMEVVAIIQYEGLVVEPSTSVSGTARAYFDLVLGALRCSEDGAAYVDCVGAGGGSGDITAVGDVLSGAAFSGTQGTILTFNNAGGDGTFDYDGTDFESSVPILINGLLITTVGIDGEGAIDLDYGSADTLDHTFISDGGTIILDGTITPGGNIIMGDNSMTGVDTITFTDTAGTIAGIQNQNLLDKTASEVITGDYDFGGGGIEIENNTAIPGSCTVGQIFLDTDGTSGSQLYACEGGSFVLQAGGGTSPWNLNSTTVRLNTSTDNVSIGADTEPSTEKLQVTGDTYTTGEFIENTGSAGTGDSVVSNRLVWTPSTDTSITAGGGITVTNAIMRIQGSGGAVDISANPQMAAGVSDGQIVILQGVSDTNTVLIEDGTGLALCGGVSFTMGKNDDISFMYDSGETEWLEWGGRCDLN